MNKRKLEELKDFLNEAQEHLIKVRNLLQESVFLAKDLELDDVYGMLNNNLIPDVEVLIDDEHNYLGQYTSVQQVLDVLREVEEELEEEED
jgi:hypothetical protein